MGLESVRLTNLVATAAQKDALEAEVNKKLALLLIDDWIVRCRKITRRLASPGAYLSEAKSDPYVLRHDCASDLCTLLRYDHFNELVDLLVASLRVHPGRWPFLVTVRQVTWTTGGPEYYIAPVD